MANNLKKNYNYTLQGTPKSCARSSLHFLTPLSVALAFLTHMKFKIDKDTTIEINKVIGVNFGKKGGFIKHPNFSEIKLEFTDDKRLDLRGLNIDSVVSFMEFENIDFSSSKFSKGGQFANKNTFKNCIFDNSRFNTNLRDQFEYCSFNKANLSGAVMGSAFINTDFENSNLSKIRGNGTLFSNCNFKGVKAKNLELHRCKFINCNFIDSDFSNGSLYGSVFEDCKINISCFSNIILDNTKGLKS